LKSKIEELLSTIKDEKLKKHPEFKNFIQEIQEECATNQELNDSIFDAAPVTISCINKNLEYIKVNKLMADKVGLDPSFFQGKKIGDTIKDSSFANIIKELFSSDNRAIIQKEIKTKNPEGKQLSYFVTAKKYHNGEFAVIIGMDVTLLKEYEYNAAFSEKMAALGELSSGIAHEINNPLQAIYSFADTIEIDLEDITEENESIDSIKESIQEIRKVTEKITDITGSLRSFSRNSRNEDFVEVSLQTILKDSKILCKSKLKGIDLSLPEEDFLFRGGEVQLNQVFVNLISNASDAINDQDNPWIKIECEKKGNKLIIDVIDSGKGIPVETQKHIFEPFFTTKGTKKGTGLGLSMVKNIMKKHKGNITIQNDSLNTHFRIVIPIR